MFDGLSSAVHVQGRKDLNEIWPTDGPQTVFGHEVIFIPATSEYVSDSTFFATFTETKPSANATLV